MICAALWSIIFVASAGLSISSLFVGKVNVALLVFLFGLSVGLLLIAAFLHGEIVVVLCNFVQYFVVAPVFLVVFPVYSICKHILFALRRMSLTWTGNIHDLSWGAKGI
mgnify:CR=1 FL=1